MNHLAQLLVIVAASIFLLLGTLHGVVTLKDLSHPRAFTPNDPALREAMQRSGIRFHPRVNLWRAWLGFNLTHSLGIVVFGAAFLYVGVFAPKAFAASPLVQSAAVVVSALYFIVSLGFFFATPTIGAAAALVCFLAAAGLSYV